MTEKKVCDLTVDPEFRDLIPPLNEEELKLLEANLVADGCESPLIVWNGVIVDGHNRYAICRKHDIPFSIQEKHRRVTHCVNRRLKDMNVFGCRVLVHGKGEVFIATC